jgi:hypothetical protein
MVEIITIYRCEICNDKFKTMKEAKICEAKGIDELLPIGTVYSLPSYDNIVFAVIKQWPKNYGHHHAYSTWACRDTDSGDNAEGEKFCGLASWDRIIAPFRIPAYERMIEALKKAAIKPIEYVESKKVVKA